MRRPYVRHASAVATSERLVHSETDSSLARFIPRGTARRRVGRPARRRLFLGSRRLGKRRRVQSRRIAHRRRRRVRGYVAKRVKRLREDDGPVRLFLGHLRLLLRRRAPSPRLSSLRLTSRLHRRDFCGLETRGIEPDRRAETNLAHARTSRRGRGTRGAKITRRHSRRRHSLCRHSRRRARARTLVRRDSRLCRDYSFFSSSLLAGFRSRMRISKVRRAPGWSCAGCSSSTRPGATRTRAIAFGSSTPNASAIRRRRRRRHRLQPSRGKPQFPFAFRSRDRARRALTTAPPYLRDDGEGTRVALLRRRERGVAFALFSRRAASRFAGAG